MKKIALTVAVLASLGLAACNKAEEANTEATDLNATTEESLNDVNAATEAADNALDNAVAEENAMAADNATNAQ